MYCTDIVDKFYNHIASDYQQYIGKTLKEVIKLLSKTHIVRPYKVCDLQNNDAVVWESRRDKMAHIMMYKDNKFYYSYKNGVKVHSVLLLYKGFLHPRFIVRLNNKEENI